MAEPSGNQAFVLVDEQGWRRGLNNLLRVGFQRWWKTRLWWSMSVMWVGIINFILAGVVFSSSGAGIMEISDLFGIFSGLFTMIAVIIIMQDAIVGERDAGTAAWVLSKPVSRQAFILAKIIPNAFGFLITMTLLPGLVAYFLVGFGSGTFFPAVGFGLALLVIWLVQCFFMLLTLMLGTFFTARGVVVGIPLALAFGQQILLNIPYLIHILPWSIYVPVGNNSSLIAALINQQPPADWMPLIVVVICIFLFTFLSLYQFRREEF
jgi:ABC-2 type transport system permease protein